MPRTKKTKEIEQKVDELFVDEPISTIKEDRVEIFEQNGKPYKKVTWKNGVATIERL